MSFLVCNVVVTAQSEVRKWKALKGDAYIDAELVDVRAGKAILKKADGEQIAVDLKKLSSDDVKYINDVTKQVVNDILELSRDETEEPSAELAEEADIDPTKIPQVQFEHFNSKYIASLWPSSWVGGIARDGTLIQLANLVTGEKRMLPMEDAVELAALNKSGDVVAVWTKSKKLRLYSTKENKLLKEISKKGLPLNDLTRLRSLFYTNLRYLALDIELPERLYIYNVEKEKLESTLPPFRDMRCMSPDGTQIIFGPWEKKLTFFDLSTGNKLNELVISNDAKENHDLRVAGVSYGRNENELMVLTREAREAKLSVYDLEKGVETVTKTIPDSFLSRYSAYAYQGPVIQTLSDNKRAVLFGAIILNLQSGESWLTNPQNDEVDVLYSKLLKEHLVCLENPARPQTQVRAIGQVPPKQGTIANNGERGLPSLTKTSATNAKEVAVPANVKLFQGKKTTPVEPVKPQAIALPNIESVSKKAFFAIDQAGKVLIKDDSASNYWAPILVDLKSGSYKDLMEANYNGEVQDISPDGNWLAIKSGSNRDRIDIIDLRTAKSKISFVPYEGDSGNMRHAKFVSNEVLITSGSSSVAWDFQTAKPLYRFEVGGEPARFSNHEHFLYGSLKKGLIVRRVSDGNVVGSLEDTPLGEGGIWMTIKVNANDSACMAYDVLGNVATWDLLTGKCSTKLTQVFSPNTITYGFDWCGDGHLLVSANLDLDSDHFDDIVHFLYSPKDKRLVWEFRMPQFAKPWMIQNGQLWFMLFESGREPQIIGADLRRAVSVGHASTLKASSVGQVRSAFGIGMSLIDTNGETLLASPK